MKTMGSFFTGGALFDVGAVEAGYKHVFGVELDPKAAAVANLNGLHTLIRDVRDIDMQQDLPYVDHFHASPPCPNFSVAKQGGNETKLDIALGDSVAQYIRCHRPETVTIENVTAYRKSQSLKRITAALEELGYFYDIHNLNAADFGVPQTRRRMILRARLGGFLAPYPKPVKWVGWYEAIEDLIDELPDTEFAPWQIDRLPHEYKTFLMAQGNRSRAVSVDEPAQTITANSNQSGVKGFIANTQESHGRGGNFTVRGDSEPVSTVAASAGEGRIKAFVVDGMGNNYGQSITIPDGNTLPVFTQTASSEKRPIRGFVGNGRVKKMNIKALGRFQTVPDWYKGLTVKINGNGVPCKLAAEIMRTFG